MIMCIAVMACTAFGTAEPMTASFCDMWPLAVGNKWYEGRNGFAGDDTLIREVEGQETHNGYTVWRILYTRRYPSGETFSYMYLIFVNGWVYLGSEEADLDALPQIGEGMHLYLPEVLQDGQTYTREVASTPVPVTVVFRSADIVELVVESFLVERFIRGQGPAQIDFGYPNYLSVFMIVGTCSGLYETQISGLQWVEAGQTARLAVPASSGPGFQWYKDGASIENASASTYLKAEAAFEDSGSYTCRIADGAKAFHDTKPILMEVFPEGSLPVSGLVSCAMMCLGCLVAGWRRVSQRGVC